MRVNDPHGVGRRNGGRANAGALHRAERQCERDHLFSVLLKEIPEVYIQVGLSYIETHQPLPAPDREVVRSVARSF